MICKQCNSKFPPSTIIDGKRVWLKTRSYCLDCSPLFSRNGYGYRKAKTPDTKVCPICDRNFKYQKNSVCTACRSTYQRHLKRSRAYEILGNKCVNCGIDDPDVLTCHHKNPEDKSFEL